MLPDIHRATQKFYIFLIVYLTGCTPTAFLFVTLVVAGWMFAPTLTSNLCSEATNRNAVSFRVLTMAEAVNLANF